MYFAYDKPTRNISIKSLNVYMIPCNNIDFEQLHAYAINIILATILEDVK